jgi:hypothetical protein
LQPAGIDGCHSTSGSLLHLSQSTTRTPNLFGKVQLRTASGIRSFFSILPEGWKLADDAPANFTAGPLRGKIVGRW